jgi:hypothetical protein
MGLPHLLLAQVLPAEVAETVVGTPRPQLAVAALAAQTLETTLGQTAQLILAVAAAVAGAQTLATRWAVTVVRVL